MFVYLNRILRLFLYVQHGCAVAEPVADAAGAQMATYQAVHRKNEHFHPRGRSIPEIQGGTVLIAPS